MMKTSAAVGVVLAAALLAVCRASLPVPTQPSEDSPPLPSNCVQAEALLAACRASLPEPTQQPEDPPPLPPLSNCVAERERKAAELKDITARVGHVDGWHTPTCDDEGLWERMQSWSGLTYQTWCVDPFSGEEEEGSRLTNNDARDRPVPCGAVASPPLPSNCVAERERKAAELKEITARVGHVDGWHTPACDENGLWEREQTFSGHSALSYQTWCVDPLTGEEEGRRLTGDAARHRDVPCGAVP